MKPQLRSFLLTASLLSAPIAIGPVAGQETASAGTESQEEIILQILELRQQIEDLMTALPPEVREEIERRWQERQSAPDVAPPTTMPSETETVTDSEPPETIIPVDPIAEATVSPLPSEEPTAALPEQATEIAAEADPPCSAIHLLDTNGDGLLSGADRQWRFLRLWFDNGDGLLEETEVESLFGLGVRQIDVNLRFYTNDDGDSEDVDAGELIELAQVGTGNSQRRTGALVIDADRLIRDGQLTFLGESHGPLAGYQPLGSGSFIADGEGNRFPVICPDLE